MEDSENEQNLENENIKKNPDVELKEYKIISKFYDKNEDDENAKEIELPSLESLEKLCSFKLVNDVVTFDKEKFNLFLEIKKENSNNEKIILNLDKILSIKNRDLVSYFLIFIGGININTEIYDHFEEDAVLNPSEDCYIENSSNYLDYLNSIIDYLKKIDKIPDRLTIELLFETLDEFGINIHRDENNVLYKNIKDSFFSMKKNKILLILTPSNNFWIKSSKATINQQNYDIKLNEYRNVFYNKKFIEKFFSRVTSHRRCVFGILCSMQKHNIKKCWAGLEMQFRKICPKNVIYLPQDVHEKLDQITYLRNMKKIKEYLKPIKKSDKDEEERDNFEYFDETNILILENDKGKINDTKDNSIYMNLFSEKFLELNEKETEAYEIESDKYINYIIKLLENCDDDIRVYINKNKVIN